MKKHNLLLMVLTLAAILLFEKASMVSAAENVAVSETSVYLVKGETTNLKVTGTSKKVTWSSANKKVASITSNGIVKAVNYGTTYVKATVNKKTYKCKITVINPSNIYFDMDNVEITINGTPVTLKLSAFDYSSADIKKTGITYMISGNASATITDNKVSATTAGSFMITAYVHGKKIDTYKMNAVASEEKQAKYVPVEAVKKNDFTGYTGNSLATLQKVRQIIDDKNLMSTSMSDRDKIVAIQTYLNNTAGSNPNDTVYQGDISRVLFDGDGVCQGYAMTFCFLCDCVDIQCFWCEGSADTGDGTGFDGHAWNKVELDGKWYYTDPSWCMAYKNLGEYFLSETLWSNHVLDENGEGYIQDIMYIGGEIPYLESIN